MDENTTPEIELSEEEKHKADRIFSITGQKSAVKELIKKELEGEKKKEEALQKQLEKEENPMSIDDIPAFKGGIFAGKKKVSDRALSQGVRRMTLKRIFNLLCFNGKKTLAELSPPEFDLYSKILVKLAGSVLPRIQEITGEEGQALTIHISREIAEKNRIDGQQEEEEKKQRDTYGHFIKEEDQE